MLKIYFDLKQFRGKRKISKCIQILLSKINVLERKELVPLLFLKRGTENKSEFRVFLYGIRKLISDGKLEHTIL